MLKCTKFYFGWGSAPDPTAGAYSGPPDLVGFKWHISKRRDGRGGKVKGGRGRMGKGGEGDRRERKGMKSRVQPLSNLTTACTQSCLGNSHNC